jgi:hypothetical protein
VEQELLTLPERPSSPQVFSGFRVTRSLVLYVYFVDRVCPFVRFLLAIVLSVLLRFTDSDYLFGIFKLFCLHVFIDSVIALSMFHEGHSRDSVITLSMFDEGHSRDSVITLSMFDDVIH